MRSSLLTVALMLVATVAVAQPADEATPPAASPPADGAATCWAGTSDMTGADGTAIYHSEMAARRTLFPSQSQVVEEVVYWGSTIGQPDEGYRLVMGISGNDGTILNEDAGMSGHATLVGEPWAWTSQTVDASLTNGMRVVATDQFNPDGVTVSKQITDTSGASLGTIVENLTTTPCEAFDAQVAAVLPAGIPE